VAEVATAGLEPPHFFVPAFAALYRETLQAFWADKPIDPLAIAASCSKTLARSWECSESEAIAQVIELADNRRPSSAIDLATGVRRKADQRRLLELAADIERRVLVADEAPDEIAGAVSELAMKVATANVAEQELYTFEQLGQEFVQEMRTLMAARQQGVEIGVYTGLPFIDRYTRGLRPGEMWILAGEPGTGKSSIAFEAAKRFAERQMKKPHEKRVGVLVASLEMGKSPSNVRLAQSLTHLDGGAMREARIEQPELAQIIEEWGRNKHLPIVFNFASHLRMSQLRAVTAEAIRKHHIGLVVIDHFKDLSPDFRIVNAVEADEEKINYLRRMAKDMDIAIIVLAHTTKAIEGRDGGRPNLSDLRGSGQVAGRADFVSFVYRPYDHASAADLAEGNVDRTAAEMIWRKNRWSLTGTADFKFDGSTMTIK
jgi:replicative DNA helicase